MTTETKEKIKEDTKGKQAEGDKKDEQKDPHEDGGCCGVCGG